jgi:selenocysteine lyase/cysteine desulfurase
MCCSKNLFPSDLSIQNVRNYLVGINKKVKLLDGTEKQYIYFDNAASTPTFTFIRDAVNEILEWYSGVHRGAGIKSLVATKAYDDSREIVARFVNANLENNTVIYTKNTTEAINKVANRLNLQKDDVVICSLMDHHSNDLPWRKYSTLIHSNVNEDGTLDLNDLEEKIKKYQKQLKLVAITGAANVTGLVNPIHQIAELAHKYGSKILVDAAQLIPHRKIDMKPDEDAQHIDFLVFSAHKMYAPFGTGVLIGPKSIFNEGDPDQVGGGTVDLVSETEVKWTHLPDREEAGTPNLIGAVALACAIQMLEKIGMDNVAQHEMEITEYAFKKINELEKVDLLGPKHFASFENKLGVLTFNVQEMYHSLVAAILCYEGGVGVRNGCFCAHPYVKKLLKVSKEEYELMKEKILAGDRSNLPGAVRASFGIYNTREEIDEFIEILRKIINKEYKGNYRQDRKTGSYYPENFKIDFSEYFSLM